MRSTLTMAFAEAIRTTSRPSSNTTGTTMDVTTDTRQNLTISPAKDMVITPQSSVTVTKSSDIQPKYLTTTGKRTGNDFGNSRWEPDILFGTLHFVILGAMLAAIVSIAVFLYCYIWKQQDDDREVRRARDRGPKWARNKYTFNQDLFEMRPVTRRPFLTAAEKRQLNSVILEDCNEYTVYVARHIGCRDIIELFATHLNIPKAKYEPAHELWRLHTHSYSDYILNVLKEWQQMNGKQATLGKLVNALIETEHNDVANALVTSCKKNADETSVMATRL